MKRLHLYTILAALTLLLCSLLPTDAQAATIQRSGKCGTNADYTLDSNGVLTISGTGYTYDYDTWDDDCAPWLDREWEDEILKIVIEPGITDIGEELFYGCQDAVSVSIPSTVTKIGANAFYNCNSLTSVTIASGVKTIDKQAFYRCSSLTSVTLPSSVTTIKSEAFAFTGLTSFTVSAGITNIDPTTFNHCGSLSKLAVNSSNANFSVDTKGVLFDKNKTTLLIAPKGLSGSYTVPSTVTTIGANAFYTCTKLTGISISSKVTAIGNSAFYQCYALTSVTTPSSVKTIGDYAFGVCDALSSVTMNGVTSIGASAFYQCYNLTSVSMNSGVKTIGAQAFYRCEKLGNITFPGTVESIGTSAITNTAYYTNLPEGIIYLGSVLYGVKGSCPSDVIVKAGTLGIADNAFSSSYITSVSLPSGLKNIGIRAFYVTNITSISIPSTVTYIGKEAFYMCSKLSSVSLPSNLKEIGDSAFESCAALTSITLPTVLQSIGNAAFKGTGLTSITIPNSVTTIGTDAFRGTKPTSIYMGTGVQTIGSGAFYIGSTTPAVYISDLAAWCRIDFETTSANPMSCGGAIYINYAKVNTITIPSTVTEIKPYAFASCTDDITSVMIHSNVKSIGKYAFYYCKSLTGITIPGSVTDIGEYAFYYCKGLKSISFSYGIKSIGGYAFGGCGAVTAITIPSSVSSIGKYAFWTCIGLTDITIPSSVTTIGEAAFKGCSGLKSIALPSSITDIPNYTFESCSGLVNITVPSNVKTIGNYAFRNCSGLTHIVLPKALTSVGSNAVYGCSKLKQVCYTGTETQRGTISFNSSGNSYLTSADWVYNAVNPVIEQHANCTEVQHICSYCKRTVWTKVKETPSHNWNEATCTTAKNCSICGTTEGEVPGHSGDLWFDIIPPTCTTEGLKARICTVCSETETQPVAALGHSYSAVVTPPTCTQQGYTTKTCASCGNVTVSDYVTATGHAYDAVITPPTCTMQGYTTNTCTTCGNVTITDYIVATGHSFGIWTLIKAATCTENGEEARTCACGEVETQPVTAIGHSYESVVTAPTCTVGGYTTNTCSACGDVTVTDPVAAKGHSWSSWIVTVKPTCTTEGTQLRFCNCGQQETEVVATIAHSYESVVTAPTCIEQGYTTNTCPACGDTTVTDYTDAKGHSWSAWIQTAAPSCKAEGSRLRFCNCGVRETETLEKLPHNYENEICTGCGRDFYFRLTLNENSKIQLNLEEDLYVDLNGYDLSGTIITNGFKVYGKDSTTDGYICENIGYFTCVDEKGNFILPERIYTEGEKQYMAICVEDRYSFHRFFVGITHMSLEPEVVGLGYKSAIYGDEMVFAELAATKAFTFRVQLEGYNPVYRRFDRNELTSGNPITLRIRNYDVENYSEHNLYAQVSLTLNDGTVIETEQVALTFRWLTEQVNANYTDCTDDQLASFKAMLQVFDIVKKWNIPNLI